MSRLRELGGDVEGALDRVKVPSYVIDEHGIIRWVNAAGMELVGDVRAASSRRSSRPRTRRAHATPSTGT